MRRNLFQWVVVGALVVGFVGVLGVKLAAGGLRPGLGAGGLGTADVLFYAFAAVTLAGAAAVALSRNILYSALGLLGALAGAGALYVLLSADFLAITQLLVYIGGVLVLILFAVMLTNRISEVTVSNKSLGVAGGVALFAAAAPVLVLVALTAPWKEKVFVPEMAPTTALVGDAFLTRWLLPFELASLVLLATLVGAVVIARKELKSDDEPEAPSAA